MFEIVYDSRASGKKCWGDQSTPGSLGGMIPYAVFSTFMACLIGFCLVLRWCWRQEARALHEEALQRLLNDLWLYQLQYGNRAQRKMAARGELMLDGKILRKPVLAPRGAPIRPLRKGEALDHRAVARMRGAAG